jgi:hypothetical protein
MQRGLRVMSLQGARDKSPNIGKINDWMAP